MSNTQRGTELARRIFKAGDDQSDKVQRIQFLGGEYPNRETRLGGLCESALAELLIAELDRLDALSEG